MGLMAKAKRKIVGERVEYKLTSRDARRLAELRGPNAQGVVHGARALLTVTYDRGGDCVDGTVAYEGDKIAVEWVNRGYNEGQWDWPADASN